MAEVIVTEVAKGLAHLVAVRATHEINLAWGFKDQLRKLNDKFENIQAFLEDAGNSKHPRNSRQVNRWVQKVKDVAYSAGNVLDEYSIEIFRRKMELKNRFTKKFCNFFSFSNPMFFRVRMAHKVNEILSLFDEIDEEAKDIGLKVDITTKVVTDSPDQEDYLGRIRQFSTLDASEFVGREHDQEILLDAICSPSNEDRDLSTVAIVGMGGMGKTTLARRLYDHETISSHFGDNKIWICVSENFEVIRLLNEMAESLTSTTSKLSNTDAIIRKLQEGLKGKKFLLVFDDVWNNNEDAWCSLKGVLCRIPSVAGSVILISTRKSEVAKAARSVFHHKLEGLSEEKSWSLLHKIVFNNVARPSYSDLLEVGMRIATKCNGVPLAIKVIAGLLQSKQLFDDWKKIEKSELWDLPHSQNHILPWLLLSFNHLPSSSVQQCFAYCALFCKGFHMYKSEYLGIWSSQGYLYDDKRKKMTMEEIGEENLKILLNNSLLEEYTPEGDNTVFYKMHDLVYDLAVYVCGSELIKETEDLQEKGHGRHLIFNYDKNETSGYPPVKALTKLRTIRFIGSVPWDLLIHTRHLRTLFVDRTGITDVPPAIGLLKHLRYLDVSYNPITTLPDSMGKLYQLQTLILQGCMNMVRLPKVLSKLVNLRHISTTAPMFAWKGLQKLTNLQSLPSLYLDDNEENGWTIDELGGLHELRDEIHILGLEFVKDKMQAEKGGLARKSNVSKLTLNWSRVRKDALGDDLNPGLGNTCDEDVLDGLEPHPNITSLEVQNFFGAKFPTWIQLMAVLTVDQGGSRARLNNLTTVSLQGCHRCQTVPALGQLPLLQYLMLAGFDVESIGLDFYGGDDLHTQTTVSFPCLREFEVFGFYKLTTWMEPPEGAFPQLETLRIRCCTHLKSVPRLTNNSLKTLDLSDLSTVETLDIIKYSSGLTFLAMFMLPQVAYIPRELANCRNLKRLSISCLRNLVTLPMGLESLVNLQSLCVSSCASLDIVLDHFVQLNSSLLTLNVCDCPSLKITPNSLDLCTALETLMIQKSPMIECSPANISNLARLCELRISFSSAEHLRSVLEAARYLQRLRKLEIDGYKDEKDMSDYFSDITPLLRLPSLTDLMLGGCQNIKTLPRQLSLLTRITTLFIWRFDDLEEVPTWIGNLSSLTSLILAICKNLKCLPSKDDLRRLLYLRINGCPLLTERYAKDGGSEWHTISHITTINLDGVQIQDLDI